MFGGYTAASTVDQHTNALGGNGEGGRWGFGSLQCLPVSAGGGWVGPTRLTWRGSLHLLKLPI